MKGDLFAAGDVCVFECVLGGGVEKERETERERERETERERDRQTDRQRDKIVLTNAWKKNHSPFPHVPSQGTYVHVLSC